MRHLVFGVAALAMSATMGHAQQGRNDGSSRGIDRGKPAASATPGIDTGRPATRQFAQTVASPLHAPASLVGGCPPGLAEKRNGCQPPGQARATMIRYSPGFFGFGGQFQGDYLYRDGYLLRSAPSGIAGWLPLLGGALSIGNAWPDRYVNRALPEYIESYYNLGSRDAYRYADRVAYRIDPETAAITSIAALLAGDDFRVGQPAPAGYDIYNVPHAYRDRYSDRPDRHYRYSDGHIYRIDPETRLVTAAIELLS